MSHSFHWISFHYINYELIINGMMMKFLLKIIHAKWFLKGTTTYYPFMKLNHQLLILFIMIIFSKFSSQSKYHSQSMILSFMVTSIRFNDELLLAIFIFKLDFNWSKWSISNLNDSKMQRLFCHFNFGSS